MVRFWVFSEVCHYSNFTNIVTDYCWVEIGCCDKFSVDLEMIEGRNNCLALETA